MIGKALEFRNPMRIDRPVHFEVAAQPLQKLWAGIFLRNLDSVVQTNKPNATSICFCRAGKCRRAGLPFAAIAIHDDRVRRRRALRLSRANRR